MRKSIVLLALVVVVASAGAAWGAVEADDLMSLVPEPDGVLTRGEFAAMLVEAAGMEGDLSAANLLAEKKILKGYPDGDLHLGQGITRVEAVSLVARTLGLRDSIAPPEEAEAPLDLQHWGYNLYAWFNHQGLVTGNPGDVLSEKQGAAFLQKVFTSDPAAIEIIEKFQASKREMKQTLRTVMSGSINIIPRPGVKGAEEIPQVGTAMTIVQEMVLPDRIHQESTVTMELPDGNLKEFTTEMYLADGKMYQQMPAPESGNMKWYRYPQGLLPNMEQIVEQAEKQAEVIPSELEDFLHYKLLGTIEIGGEEVYQLAFYGRIDDFNKFMEAAMGQFGDTQQFQQSISQATAMIDSMSYWGIEYIGVNDYLPRSAEYSSFITYVEEMEGEPIPLAAIEINMKIKEYSLGEDIVIEVPREALEAPVLELPGLKQ
ncbi:MAG: S-layer homology domain-containing protein [Thermoanaerobacteraceae bacterium]|nr:S-layer homology domain-containing protein [Thermoanaerobacteraceae bacterium]